MNATYKLVELAKVNTNIHSDNGIAKLLGISRQKISNWKADQSEANALNTLKLIKIAGLSIDESIDLVEGRNFKQNGFITIAQSFVTALTGIALLASMHYSDMLYIMLNRCYVELKLLKVLRLKRRL